MLAYRAGGDVRGMVKPPRSPVWVVKESGGSMATLPLFEIGLLFPFRL
jgi:hypothetical protein